MKYLIIVLSLVSIKITAQEIKGHVFFDGLPLAYANVYLKGTSKGTTTNEDGSYVIKVEGGQSYTVIASYTGFKPQLKTIDVANNHVVDFNFENSAMLDEVVVTGTLKSVSRLESPVPVEVYSPLFLKKNPTPNIFEALQNVNGVRPQINCSVCNTGDIHINGLEGPYTLVLIDGMPIVSGLSTVYGLSGIPNSLIEQVEIVKGPASSLYGSEAVGGLINIITKLPENAPLVFADSYISGWGEWNLDLGFKAKLGDKTDLLLGVNYFNYSNSIDNNNDNFTDLTLQDRISVFQKWNFKRKNNRIFSLAGRFFYEDRWGGELQWNPSYRGGEEVYGESIYTSRYELLGKYQLPVKEQVMLQFSYTDHDQNSVYGNTPYLAKQRIGFTQFTWDKPLKNHDLLFGIAARYNYYNDNTPATPEADEIVIPSFFVQDEMKLHEKHTMLLGGRYDYDKRHGNIFTPRIAYKFKPSQHDVLRLNAGTGFRVVNLFTEEHAALTGSRDVVITEALKPERSINVNLNYLTKLYTKKGNMFTIDASAWYTYFSNLIAPDYETDTSKIIYDNLDGKAVSKGVSLNLDTTLSSGIKVLVGATLQDVSQTENNITKRQILTESFTGTWGVTYKNYKYNTSIDYTGNLYGPMDLPLLGDDDPRLPESPVWSIQNIQFTFSGLESFEFYGGIKNLLNWTPNEGNPFIIARADDPFEKDPGKTLAFDPSYIYAPNQGRRLFFGLRYTLN